jgi:lysophospholipase L1-like esterase
MKYVVIATLLASLPAWGQKFDFSTGKAEPYSDERGYGIEPGAKLFAGAASIMSEMIPIYFSAKVPSEGNYRVTVTMGDSQAPSVTTIKAELRRLMVEKMKTRPGESVSVSFIVNTRTPRIDDNSQVRLKDREKTSEAWAWDDRITLEFGNTYPSISSIEIEKVDVPTLYIAGDSTATDQSTEPFNSWGQMLPRFFNSQIAVANHAESGETLRSFIEEGRLAKLSSLMKPGDWLMIQMGHNDQKEKGPGIGAFTSFKASLKEYIAEARKHGATPVLVTPMHRLMFDSAGRVTNSLGDYPEAVRQVGAEEKVAVIDLNAMSKAFYEALGPKEAPKAFADGDTTHHSDYGSYELARCIVQGIRDSKLDLVKYLTDDVGPFKPSRPDPLAKFELPPDPPGTAAKPEGN